MKNILYTKGYIRMYLIMCVEDHGIYLEGFQCRRNSVNWTDPIFYVYTIACSIGLLRIRLDKTICLPFLKMTIQRLFMFALHALQSYFPHYLCPKCNYYQLCHACILLDRGMYHMEH
jgi:hypothetical protein